MDERPDTPQEDPLRHASRSVSRSEDLAERVGPWLGRARSWFVALPRTAQVVVVGVPLLWMLLVFSRMWIVQEYRGRAEMAQRRADLRHLAMWAHEARWTGAEPLNSLCRRQVDRAGAQPGDQWLRFTAPEFTQLSVRGRDLEGLPQLLQDPAIRIAIDCRADAVELSDPITGLVWRNGIWVEASRFAD